MPLTYTGPADVVAELKSVFRGGVPQDVASPSRDTEDVEAFAEIMCLAEQTLSGWIRQSVIRTATGVWLEQHARDRGLRKQGNEDDDRLRARLSLPPAAGTTSAILDSIKALLGIDGVILVELPRSSLYLDRKMGLNRGRRLGAGRGVVIVLIPASLGARASVADLLRTKASAGKITQVEEYAP